jgi:hypothetical protein
MSLLTDLENQKAVSPPGNAGMLKPCSRCGQLDYEVRFAINKDGKPCYPYFCKVCNARGPIIASKEFAKSLGFSL